MTLVVFMAAVASGCIMGVVAGIALVEVGFFLRWAFRAIIKLVRRIMS